MLENVKFYTSTIKKYFYFEIFKIYIYLIFTLILSDV